MVSRIRFPEIFSLFSTAGLTALAIPESVPGASVQGTPPLALNFTLLAGNQSPQFDQQCILSGERLKPRCVVANDRDAKRARAEEASLRLRAVVAAKSGQSDSCHQAQTSGEPEIFDVNLSGRISPAPSRASFATCPRSAFLSLNSVFAIEYAAHRIHLNITS